MNFQTILERKNLFSKLIFDVLFISFFCIGSIGLYAGDGDTITLELGKEGESVIQKIEVLNIEKNTAQNKGYTIKDKNGKTKYNGKNEIFFRQKYKNKTVGRDFQQLNQRMSQYKPWFLKGGYLTTIFWLTVILSVGGVYLLITKKEK